MVGGGGGFAVDGDRVACCVEEHELLLCCGADVVVEAALDFDGGIGGGGGGCPQDDLGRRLELQGGGVSQVMKCLHVGVGVNDDGTSDAIVQSEVACSCDAGGALEEVFGHDEGVLWGVG